MANVFIHNWLAPPVTPTYKSKSPSLSISINSAASPSALTLMPKLSDEKLKLPAPVDVFNNINDVPLSLVRNKSTKPSWLTSPWVTPSIFPEFGSADNPPPSSTIVTAATEKFPEPVPVCSTKTVALLVVE